MSGTCTSPPLQTADLLAALHRIGMQLAAGADRGSVLQQVVDTATALLNARHASLMLLDASRRTLSIAAAAGLSAETLRLTRVPVGEGVAGWVAHAGRPWLVAEGAAVEPGADESAPLEAVLCVPLRARGEVLGVLHVGGRQEGGDFGEEALQLSLLLADQAALAIDSARLHEAQERKLREISVLYEVGRAVNSSLERDDTLKLVLQCAMALFRARHGSLMLLDERREFLQIVAAEGLSREIIRQARPRVGEGIAGRVAQTGQPVLLKKGARDAGSGSSRRDAPAALSVPIQRDGMVIGVLNVRNREDDCDFTHEDLELMMHLSAQAAVAIDNATLHESLRQLFMGTVRALVNAIDARDPYTEKHSERVRAFAIAIGQRLGFSEERLERLEIAALLHDIGKISIGDDVLLKPGKLTAAEYDIVKQHPVVGARIISQVAHLRPVVPFLYHHHEKFGEPGYPAGIQGEEIPIEARILAVADTFDAMTSQRPYRDALPHDAAVHELRRNSGTQFDPAVVQAFLAILDAGALDLTPHSPAGPLHAVRRVHAPWRALVEVC